MTSHENFLSNIETCLRANFLPHRDAASRNLVSVPLFHVTGCNSQLLPTLRQGGTTVIMPSFDVQLFLQTIVAERITNVTTVPAILWLAISSQNFASFDTSGVHVVAYGGAPIAPSLVAQVIESFPNARVGNGFGLTETASVATFLPHEFAADHADSVGFPAPVVDLEILKPDPETGVGELLIRGANVVRGYWGKPAETTKAFQDGCLRWRW